jgi:CrcB protein
MSLFEDRRMWKSSFAIAPGAALGAFLRWLWGLRLHAFFPTLPPGTLIANLIGGHVLGLAIAFFRTLPKPAPEWRPLVITGICGGLTLFTTISAETAALLQQGRTAGALAGVAWHVPGSVMMTYAGIATVASARSSA